MARVAILADTHIPSRASEHPDWVVDELEAADHVIHAGDFDSQAAYETFIDLVDTPVTAVHGNMDPRNLDLPAVATTRIAGREFVVTHGSGPVENYHERVLKVGRAELDTAEGVVVAGHTHQVVDEQHDDLRFLNPGSATGAAPATRTTMLRVTVDDGLGVEVLDG